MRLAVLVLLLSSAARAAGPVVLPRFPLGKATTFIHGPLDARGYVDYAAALNERGLASLKPQDNAAAWLWKAMGPQPEGVPVAAAHFALLGIERPPAKGSRFVGLDIHAARVLKLDGDALEAFYDEATRACRQAWTAKGMPRVAAWLEANEKALEG